MLKWLPFPMVRASMAFTLGIIMGFEVTFDPEVLELWCALGFFFYGGLLKALRSSNRMVNLVWTPITLGLLIITGILRSQTCLHLPDSKVTTAEYFLATVKHPTYQKGKYYVTDLAINRVWSDGVHFPVDDHMLWYQASDNPIQLLHGRWVVLKGKPQQIEPPQNPLEFDYAEFMARKNIFWNFWSWEDDVIAVLPGQRNAVQHWIYGFRNHLKAFLVTGMPPGKPLQISLAMLLGDRMAVSDQLEDAFARSGTMHILAVSGLHLGILYWFIVQLIGKWRSHFLFKWLFVLISLLILWAFALLSGAAASTQRAATMFSIMIIANVINKESNALNTLAISGLIILWVDPYQLYSVGFQLSFLALGGILYLQPWIVDWRKFENRIIQYLWQLVSVSLAAQIAVLPLSAYYFHQLPVYFLMANIFLVPLSFAIVITGMVVFACSSIPALSSVAMEPLTILTNLAGFMVEAIAEIPGSSIQGLQLDVVALSLWYGILVSAILFLRTRARWALMTLLCLWLFISLKRICHQLKANGSANIMVYQIPGHTAIDFVSGKYLWALADSDFTSDPKTTEFKVGHYRRYLGLEQQGHIQTDETDGNPSGMWMFGGKRLLLVKSPIGRGFNNNIKIKSDIVVVTENSLDHVQQIKSMVDFELLVIDGSNSRKNASKLQEQARELGLEVHNCWEQGFKNINL